MIERDFSKRRIFRQTEEPGEWITFLVKYPFPTNKNVRRIWELSWSVMEQRFRDCEAYRSMMAHPVQRLHVAEVERIAKETAQ